MPASFPDSIFNPTTKQTGDPIQPSHINDLQTEVIAIEQGYRQATAPLNSSGSTVTSLSVTGGSMFAGRVVLSSGADITGNSSITGALSVSGNSTIGGNVTVGGTLTVGGIGIGGRQPVAKVSLAAATVSINSGTWTQPNWTVNEVDSTGIHSTSANSSRMLLTSSGLWMAGVTFDFIPGTPASTTVLGARILANDNEGIAGTQVFAGAPTLTDWPLSVTALYYATDTASYLTAGALQTGGSAMNLRGSSGAGVGRTSFWVQKVSN
jgi:hypothetical protein